MVNVSLIRDADNRATLRQLWAIVMSEHDEVNNGRPEGGAGRELCGPSSSGAQAEDVSGRTPTKQTSSLPAIIVPILRAEPDDAPRAARSKRFALPRLAVAAAIALAAFGVGAGVLVMNDHRSQAGLLAEHAHETQALARTVDALTARLDAIENAKAHDELVELRRSVGEIKAGAASSQELGSALSQLSQRVEKLDREASAKVEKLGERFDHEATAETAELSARIEKLEKKVVAAAAPTSSPPPGAPAQPRQPAVAPKFGANVSMETTGSIQRPRTLLRRYVVLGVRDDVALIEGRDGERAVRPGDVLPGAGRVERIEPDGESWVVVTDQGLIGSAEQPY
jgi:uncharacterized protein YoxC